MFSRRILWLEFCLVVCEYSVGFVIHPSNPHNHNQWHPRSSSRHVTRVTSNAVDCVGVDRGSRRRQSTSLQANEIPNEHRSFVRSIRCRNLAGLISSSPASRNETDHDVTLRHSRSIQVNLTTATASSTCVAAELSPPFHNNVGKIENLIVVTGETGAGKSLLFRKTLELLCGSKVTPSLVLGQTSAKNDEEEGEVVVEMEVVLHEPHFSVTQSVMEQLGLDPWIELSPSPSSSTSSSGLFTVQRKMKLVPLSSSSSSRSRSSQSQRKVGNGGGHGRRRLKSTCTINGQTVTLAALERIVSPLIAIVDANVAAAALATSSSGPRMAILDTGVTNETTRIALRQAQQSYRLCRHTREALEQSLSERILPVHFSPSGGGSGGGARDDTDTELLQHWVDELDRFETRVRTMCSALGVDSSSAMDVDDARGTSLNDDNDDDTYLDETSNLAVLARHVASLSWKDNLHQHHSRSIAATTTRPRKSRSATGRMASSLSSSASSSTSSGGFSSALFRGLNDVRDAMLQLDQQLENARMARELMGSLGSKQSALTAVERTRELLVDAPSSSSSNTASTTLGLAGSSSSRLSRASERAHELLTMVEESIQDFCDCLEDEGSDGLIRAIEDERSACATVSKDDIESLLLEWSTLARKHGIASSLLPSCHEALQAELSGNVDAVNRLPVARAEEQISLQNFQAACSQLSQERTLVADQLSRHVTAQLPRLGLGHSIFEVVVQTDARKCTDVGVYNTPGNGPMVGVDAVNFRLSAKRDIDSSSPSRNSDDVSGSVHVVAASSGEKARLLLAIECALPGSVGAACRAMGSSSSSSSPIMVGSPMTSTMGVHNDLAIPGPVLVLYDEIDAHVGGHAAVSLAGMLVDQSETCQVVAITHNPSVAASGDVHLVVRRERRQSYHGDATTSPSPTIGVTVDSLKGPERRKELARMASGDLAPTEAEIFADALIRDGSKRRVTKIVS